MSLLGIRLTLLIGPTRPVPAPAVLMEAFESIEVTHSDEGQSGFQLSFKLGRGTQAAALDYPLLHNPLLRPFTRVIVMVTFNATPQVLMDGIITNRQIAVASQPGASTLTVTGEDVSFMMGRIERSFEHSAQDDRTVALRIIGTYGRYGLTPRVLPPPNSSTRNPSEGVPTQQGTDLQHLRDMAARHGFVFYVMPGRTAGQNIAFWGPPIRDGESQRALSVNMGSATNVESLSFQHSSVEPTLVTGKIQDRESNQSIPIQTTMSTRRPLSGRPDLMVNRPFLRRQQFRETGLETAEAFERAQSVTNRSTDNVVNGTGELNALNYGGLLKARALVGVRGAGFSFDGDYYVKSVTHSIRKGEYKQRFTLTREGTGSLTPTVIP